MKDFSGRTALVTGGGSGIGAALTRALAAAGAVVTCSDVDGEAAEKVSSSVTASAVRLDVTDASAVQSVVDGIVEQHGRIDLVFNNAGVVFGGETQDLALEHWNAVIDVNLRGVVHGVHAAYPHMIRAGRGQIVNTASGAGLLPMGLLTSYSATKFAVVGLSLSLRAEAARHGVGVTVVCPGAIDTPILDKGAVGRFRGRDYYRDLGRSKRVFPPDRLAELVLSGAARDEPWVLAPFGTKVGWSAFRWAPRTTHKQLTRMVRAEQERMRT